MLGAFQLCSPNKVRSSQRSILIGKSNMKMTPCKALERLITIKIEASEFNLVHRNT